jgi:2-deoxy-D-gluconate 3-dehydrogenase
MCMNCVMASLRYRRADESSDAMLDPGASNAGLTRRSFGAGTLAAGLAMTTRALAADWAVHKITVNAILPGWLHTDLTNGAIQDLPGLYERVLARTPQGRWGQPEDLAGVAVFLASRASDFVTGVALVVDGGYSVMAP